MRCIGKVEAPKSGETFPAIFIHLSDSGCTNYLRNLLGFGYDPKDADYHFDPESAGRLTNFSMQICMHLFTYVCVRSLKI